MSVGKLTPCYLSLSDSQGGCQVELSGRPGEGSREPGCTEQSQGREICSGNLLDKTHPSPSYKDSLVNPATPKKSSCGRWAVVAECSSGQSHFAKKLVCGKEYCQVCGEDNSAAHKRRQARILKKLQKVSQLGYFVIEWPEVYRHIGARGFSPDLDGKEYVQGWVYSKADLKATTKTIVDVLGGKRCGRRGRVNGHFKRGLLRWHWFGQERPGKWNPHLNVFVDGGHLEPELLETIKAELRAALNVPDLIVHYSYFDKPGQMVQKARYITRSTFRNYAWSPYMAGELWNFRNMRSWGIWQGEAVWRLADAAAEGEDVDGLAIVSKLQDGLCPDCGLPLKVRYYQGKERKPVYWSKPADSTYLAIWGATEIAGTAYYRIPHEEWSSYSFSPGGLLEPELLESLNRLIEAKHKRLVQAKITRLEQAEADKALLAEVDELAENSFGSYGEPRYSGGGDKAVCRPTCLGEVSLLGEIRLSRSGEVSIIEQPVGRGCRR